MAAEQFIAGIRTDPFTWWHSLSESDQAQWAGAFGSVAAVLVAVFLFAVQSWGSRRDKARVQTEIRYYRATVLLPLILNEHQKLSEWVKESVPGVPCPPPQPISEELISGALDAARNFDKRMAIYLVEFAVTCQKINSRIKILTVSPAHWPSTDDEIFDIIHREKAILRELLKPLQKAAEQVVLLPI